VIFVLKITVFRNECECETCTCFIHACLSHTKSGCDLVHAQHLPPYSLRASPQICLSPICWSTTTKQLERNILIISRVPKSIASCRTMASYFNWWLVFEGSLPGGRGEGREKEMRGNKLQKFNHWLGLELNLDGYSQKWTWVHICW